MIHEIQCGTILNRSRIPGLDYTLNPYLGCMHGCVYCYARFMTRFAAHHMEWGTFADAKINAPEILAKQIGKLAPGKISLSTVTDPYQPAEKKYKITRSCLQQLAQTDFSLQILTRSDLVLRDLDLLKSFPGDRLEVGFSFSTMDDTVRAHFEPGATTIDKRMEALTTLHDTGIRTWIFLAPILPFLTERSLDKMLDTIRDKVDYMLVDQFNIKQGNWQGTANALRGFAPELLKPWADQLFNHDNRRTANRAVIDKINTWGKANAVEIQTCGPI